ncbi:SCO3933 family regulatory protein [Streptosporangium canum]|uniref:SCO3933 family regulatory protein n=1 Tax=Streptosporangium canum TaxID=324952 RepID=UPI0037A9E27A
MRNIPIPVDVARLQFICVKAPCPRIVNKETGELKTDKASGQTVYEVLFSVEDTFGKIELVKIGVVGEPPVAPGNEVKPVGLVGYVWELSGRWGIAYRASALLPAAATVEARGV